MSEKQRSSAGRVFTILFLLLLGVLTPAALFGWSELYYHFFETDSPKIAISNLPVGLGSVPADVVIELTDSGAGLEELIIRREQNGELTELKRKRYTDGKRVEQDNITLPLGGADSGVKAGTVKIIVTVFDHSFWSNKGETSFDLRVDYKPPLVNLVSTQHNATMGGVELVFYRVEDRDEVFSGVKAGPWLFPGFRAKKLDRDFEAINDLYFAFFAIPLGFDPAKDKLQVYARDIVGNLTNASVSYRLSDFARAKRTITLPSDFLTIKVDKLYQDYLELEAKVNPGSAQSYRPPSSDLDYVERFKLVNHEYRKLLNSSIQRILSSPKGERFWSGRFNWFSGRQNTFFGEETEYKFGDLDAGVVVQEGDERSNVPRSPVRAGNNGIVIFADELGLFGKTLILDHGFGLTSMYANLSEISKLEGDRVVKDEAIGISGDTGLALSDRLHFEMRLFGVPVRPAEWWDAKWIEDHIEQKIRDTKKALGIAVRKAID